MSTARTWNTSTDESVVSEVQQIDDFLNIEREVFEEASRKNQLICSIEIERDDDWTLAVSYASEALAMLTVVQPPGSQSWSTRARPGRSAIEVGIFNFMGSWSEADGNWFVPLGDAHVGIEAFLSGTDPMDERLSWSVD